MSMKAMMLKQLGYGNRFRAAEDLPDTLASFSINSSTDTYTD